MPEHYRVQLYWLSREDSLAWMSQQLYMLLTGWRSIDEDFASWSFFDKKKQKPVEVVSKKTCQRLLEQTAVSYCVGDKQCTAYQPKLILTPRDDDRAEPLAKLQLSCGIQPMQLPVYTPNRLSFRAHRDLGEHGIGPLMLRRVLQIAATTYRADWGYAGIDSFPQPPVALFSDGTPCVGWMTYLSTAYPSLPGILPAEAQLFPVSSDGHIILAYPNLFDDGDARHLKAVAQVNESLREAKVLVPALRLANSRAG